jgi:acyl carrier protein
MRRDMDVLDSMLEHAIRTPDAVAVRDQTGSLTYGELAAAVRRAGSALRAAGVGTGDEVALLLPRSVDSLIAPLAVAWTGARGVLLESADPALLHRRAGVRLIIGTSPLSGTDLPCLLWDDLIAPRPVSEGFDETPARQADDGLSDSYAALAEGGMLDIGMSPQERTVADIWSDAFGFPVTDPDADFFTLGGHSLLALGIAEELRQRFGVSLTLSEVFAAPTVAEQAKLLGAGVSVSTQVP